jgi:hypothetical protein
MALAAHRGMDSWRAMSTKLFASPPRGRPLSEGSSAHIGTLAPNTAARASKRLALSAAGASSPLTTAAAASTGKDRDMSPE